MSTHPTGGRARIRPGLVVLLALALLAASCGEVDEGIGPSGPVGPDGIEVADDDGDRIEGSGTMVTESRDVAGFDRVSLSGEGDVVITHGDIESLTLTTDDNLLELTDTVVTNGTLELGTPIDVDIDPTEATFEIVVTDLSGIELSGAGSFGVDRFSTDESSIDVSGAGDVVVADVTGASHTVVHTGVGSVRVAGAVDRLLVTLTGVGQLVAHELAVAEATVEVGGTSSATVWVADTLDATVAGTGELRYWGEPDVSSEVRGLATLTPLGPRTSPPSSSVPEAVCDEAEVYAVVDAAIADARLAEGGTWASDLTANPFAERTVTGDVVAERFGLDCGMTASSTTSDGAERLLLAAWTGPRTAFLVQGEDAPSMPYVPFVNFQFVTEEVRGEFLRDDQSLWGGVLADGTTVLVGHVDYNLGVMAKEWQAAVAPLPNAEPTIDAERYAIATLEAAGQRNVAVAQAAEFGAELGRVMFVSPTGQINVAAVAPEGWIDPTVALSVSGPTTTATIDGVEVRITEPAPDDLFSPRGAEIGWWCADHGWVLEPPINGTADEMLEVARAVIATETCQTPGG